MMKCPDCETKITTKDYDPEYEWYECPKCEGAFTVDEIQGGTDAEQNGNSEADQGRKASGGRGKKRSHAGRTNGKASAGDDEIRERVESVKPLAKGKKRRTEIAEDEAAIAAHEAEILKPTVRRQEKHHRDELDTMQVLGIWQDEIQDIYHELGQDLDEHNARDKALIVWREIHIQGGVAAREQAVAHALCEEHE